MRSIEWNGYHGYPDRVTKGEDGTYRWSGRLDKEYERRDYIVTLWTCAGICMLIMLLTALTDLKSLWITGPCAAAIMGIAGIICLLLDRAKGSARHQYEMNEEYVRLVNGKYSRYYEYPKISGVEVKNGYLEVRRNRVSNRFYVPEEDMAFVAEYITSRCIDRRKGF